MKTKFGINQVLKKTPILYRKIGTTIVTVCLGLTPIIMNSSWDPNLKANVATWIGIVGVLAKGLMCMFSEDECEH